MKFHRKRCPRVRLGFFIALTGSLTLLWWLQSRLLAKQGKLAPASSLEPLQDPFDSDGVFRSQHESKRDALPDDFGRIDWHDWQLIARERLRSGPGEQGLPVNVTGADSRQRAELRRVSGYNAQAGDLVSLARSVPDKRHQDCHGRRYAKRLPTVSIVIAFYEEHFSSLMRTVVACLNRAPPELIEEVLLVDDGSSHKPFLKKPLEDFIAKTFRPGLVRVVRSPERQGLIRNRMLGASHARGEVLLFLDSHCEPGVNYLPPLLEPIALDYRTVTCPVIDIIDMNDMRYRMQGEHGFRGTFDWFLTYRGSPRLPVDWPHLADNFDSPVMAGGLFAISKRWFDELGQYDPGMYIWGGEQYELSFKLWMCGGRQVDVPCSRIAHLFRKALPYKHNHKDSLAVNLKRVAEVWMDDFARFVYMWDDRIKLAKPGNLTERHELRKRLNCQSFDWYMKHVAYEVLDKLPLTPPKLAMKATLRLASGRNTSHCMGARNETSPDESQIPLVDCNKSPRIFHYTYTGQIDATPGRGTYCVDRKTAKKGQPLQFVRCQTPNNRGSQFWAVAFVAAENVTSSLATLQLQTNDGKSCLQADLAHARVILGDCLPGTALNTWVWGDRGTFQDVLKSWKTIKQSFLYCTS